MLYEVRERVAVPGSFATLLGYFNEHTRPALARQGMRFAQAGSSWTGENSFNQWVSTISFVDPAEGQSEWAFVVSDPQWAEGFGAAETGGPFPQTMKWRSA